MSIEQTSNSVMAPIACAAGGGRVLMVLGAPYVIKASAADTGSFCCIESEVPPGAGVPPHTHAGEDEAFYVLSGTITFETAGLGTQRLGPGSLFFGPRGIEHTFRNETGETARMLVYISPGAGMEAMFGEIDAAGRVSKGPLSGEVVADIAARYGITFAPPA